MTVYDCSALAEKLDGWGTFDSVKSTMLKAIGDIAVAQCGKDAELALEIQSNLMWVFEIIDSIKIKEVEQ